MDAAFSDNAEVDYAKHKEEVRPAFVKGLDEQLKVYGGPYVLGAEVSYADLVIYQICHDEGLTKEGRNGLEGFAGLKGLVDAVEGRKGVKAFLESERYLG